MYIFFNKIEEFLIKGEEKDKTILKKYIFLNF